MIHKMTEQEKQLLLVDLCERIPYKIMFMYNGKYGEERWPIVLNEINRVNVNSMYEIEGCKPYLRPMSDMTTEEDHEFALLQNDFYSDGQLYPIAAENLLEWLKRGNFDYHGLIHRGLALKAPKWMYHKLNRNR